MLHKEYYRKGLVVKKSSGRQSQGAWRQDELIGGKPPGVKVTLTLTAENTISNSTSTVARQFVPVETCLFATIT
jgi:hypothetical protein